MCTSDGLSVYHWWYPYHILGTASRNYRTRLIISQCRGIMKQAAMIWLKKQSFFSTPLPTLQLGTWGAYHSSLTYFCHCMWW